MADMIAASESLIHCEGALDLQYLSTRFARGTREVAEYMASNHRYVTVNELADAHADQIKFQREQGGTGQPFLASSSDKDNHW